MSTASKVAEHKAKHPELYCKHPRCLWRTGGGLCPRHTLSRSIPAETLPAETQETSCQQSQEAAEQRSREVITQPAICRCWACNLMSLTYDTDGNLD